MVVAESVVVSVEDVSVVVDVEFVVEVDADGGGPAMSKVLCDTGSTIANGFR